MKKENKKKEEKNVELKKKETKKVEEIKVVEEVKSDSKETTTEMIEKKKKVNLPNILTIVRILLVPVFVILMALNGVWEYMKYIALGIFVIASVTDWLDGYIARKNKIITRFGKLMDPLADKILVAAGFIMLTGMDVVPAWVTVIVVARDFLLNTLRMFGTEAGETIAAGVSGKIKTAFQMLTIVLGMIDTQGVFAFVSIGKVMEFGTLLLNVGFSLSLSFAVIFTLWSCVEYFVKYRKYIDITE